MSQTPPDALREWTCFAYAGWRDAGVTAPRSALPAADLLRLGLGPLLATLLRDRRDERVDPLAHVQRVVGGQNLLLFARAMQARDALMARGIVPVLVKGGAFLLRYSARHLGLRALADLDLLVGPDRFDEAFALLTASGWRRASPELRLSSRVAPAITLVARDGTMVDLHRHLAQWPLLRTWPARVVAAAETASGWPICSASDGILVVATHRARHAFAADARELFDLAVASASLTEEGWSRTVRNAREIGIEGALYGALRQAVWWFGVGDDVLTARVRQLRVNIGHVRAAVLDRMANPAYPLTKYSPFAGPAGRNFAVFPMALGAPVASLGAAAVFLSLRAAEGGRPTRRSPAPF